MDSGLQGHTEFVPPSPVWSPLWPHPCLLSSSHSGLFFIINSCRHILASEPLHFALPSAWTTLTQMSIWLIPSLPLGLFQHHFKLKSHQTILKCHLPTTALSSPLIAFTVPFPNYIFLHSTYHHLAHHMFYFFVYSLSPPSRTHTTGREGFMFFYFQFLAQGRHSIII